MIATKPLNNVLSFYKDPIAFLGTVGDNAVTSFRMAHLPFHHVSGLDEIRQVLVHNSTSFVKTPQAQYYTSKALGAGLVSTDGNDWLEKKRESQSLFTATTLKSYFPELLDEAQRSVSGITSETTTSLRNFMLELTLRLITRVSFGFTDTTSIERISSIMETMIAETYRKVVAPLNLPLFIPTPANQRFNTSRREYHDIISELTRKALLEGNANCFAKTLEAVIGNKNGNSTGGVANALKTIVAAGHETTATTLSWLLIEVSRHPDVQKAMRSELSDVDLSMVLSNEELISRTPYTQLVIKETMRMYPAIWLMGRMAVEETTIGNTLVKKNDNVLISPFIIHRHKKYWDLPDEFIPGRFSSADKSNDGALFPFGLGPRQCVGGNLAITEMLLLLAVLFNRFELNVKCSSQQVSPHPYITLRPPVDVLLRLTPVKS